MNIHIHPHNKSFKVQNTKLGIKKLLTVLQSYNIGQIVCEATGGYEYLLLQLFTGESIDIWLVEPKRVRAFIVSEGVNAKTDKIDAHMLALFAATKKPKHGLSLRSHSEEKIRSLCRRRKNLVNIIVQEKNRLDHPQQVHCRVSIQKHISFLELEIESIEKEMSKLISSDDRLNNKIKIIESVPGIGKVTALALVSHMPELGTTNDKQIAALLGVAPFVKQSGNYKGATAIRGGRWEARNCMYMAALTAARYNPKLKAFHEKLRNAGKKPKVVLVALMRKLIVIINNMIRNNELWRVA